VDSGGRRAVSEVMLNNSAISNMIREGKMHQIDNVIRTSSDIGMIYLERSLVNLVREGAISVQRAQEYAVNPEEVLRLTKELRVMKNLNILQGMLRENQLRER